MLEVPFWKGSQMACPNAIMSDMPAEYALQYATSANL